MTVTIDDDLLAEAKAIAARSHRTVGPVLEDALREMIARHELVTQQGPLALPTSGGGGLRHGGSRVRPVRRFAGPRPRRELSGPPPGAERAHTGV